MEESVTYQAIVEKGVAKGRLIEARRILILLGEDRFGAPPSPLVRARIESIDSLELLEELLDRIVSPRRWEELFPDLLPPARRPRRRRKP